MNSFVRWAGSKRLLISELATYRPKSMSRYVEPFAGSACFFFFLEPEKALLGDLNPELILMYREVRRDVDLVLECFRRLPRGERAYYAVRRRDPRALAPAEAAARFIYLNRFCFNGLFRTNLEGRFNVPYGPPKKPLNAFEDRVREAATLLRNAELRAADFERIVADVRKGDFVYLDPPYVVRENSEAFSEYLPGSFASRDLERLSDALDRIDRGGATFLLSYARSSEADALARRWSKRSVSTRRNIAGFSGARKTTNEILVTNIQ